MSRLQQWFRNQNWGFWILMGVVVVFLSWCATQGKSIAACEKKVCPNGQSLWVSSGTSASGTCLCVLSSKVGEPEE